MDRIQGTDRRTTARRVRALGAPPILIVGAEEQSGGFRIEELKGRSTAGRQQSPESGRTLPLPPTQARYSGRSPLKSLKNAAPRPPGTELFAFSWGNQHDVGVFLADTDLRAPSDGLSSGGSSLSIFSSAGSPELLRGFPEHSLPFFLARLFTSFWT